MGFPSPTAAAFRRPRYGRARPETVQLAMRPNTAPTTPSGNGLRPEKVDKAQLRCVAGTDWEGLNQETR